MRYVRDEHHFTQRKKYFVITVRGDGDTGIQEM
jgi:hypothetical protein